MEKSTKKRNLFTRWFLAFLAIAIVFLAVGLGTLGSTAAVGKAFELKTERASDAFNVVVELSRNGTERYTENGVEKTRDYTLNVKHVYVNVATVYAEAGTPGTLRLQFGTSAKAFSSSTYSREVELQNFFTPEDAAAEGSGSKKLPLVENALFRWVSPFDDMCTNLSSSYRYACFTATSHDLLINEIVFVGEKVVSSKPTGEYIVIPATVESATVNNTENPEISKARAQESLFDAQAIPSEVQSSYYNFTKDELYTLSTLAEMRRGGEYDASLPSSAYHVESVYGPLGVDLIALGTEIFGTSPFGLRFFPMLASFGVLVIGYFFAKQLAKSEKAGVVFAALYALCNLSFSLGHLGNPLMIGVFFFVASLYLCHTFYSRGMKKTGAADVLPLVFSGLSGAAAICVNGAFILPVAGVVGLFACGLVRQQKAKRHRLDVAIERAQEPGAEEDGKTAALGVVQEYRAKNLAACFCFAVTLILGSVLFSLLFAIPLYTPYLRFYTTASSANIFSLAAKAFAGGFVGSNAGTALPAWGLFSVLFEGTGTFYAVTAAAINAIAAIAGVLGLAFTVYRLVCIIRGKKLEKPQRSELRKLIVPLAGLVISLILTAFGGGSLGFLVLAYVFSFMLFGNAAVSLTEREGKIAKASKICIWVGLGLLIVMFALYAIFTFSIPVSAGLMGKIL